MRNTGRIGVTEASWYPIGTGNPAEQVIERSILHRDNDDVIDFRSFRIGVRIAGVATSERSGSGRDCELRDEIAARDTHLLFSFSLALEDDQQPAANGTLTRLIGWTVHYLSLDHHRSRATTVEVHCLICTKLHHRLRQLTE